MSIDMYAPPCVIADQPVSEESSRKNIIMNNPLFAVINLLSIILTLLTYAIIIRVLLSWFRVDPRNFLVQMLNRVTDPILGPLGRLIPPIAGLDITPIIAIFLVHGVQRALPMLIGAY